MKHGIIIDERGQKIGEARKDSRGVAVRFFDGTTPEKKWRIIWDDMNLGLRDCVAVIIA